MVSYKPAMWVLIDMNQFQVRRHDMNYSHRARLVDNDWNFFLGSLVDIIHLPIHLVMTTKFIQIIDFLELTSAD